MKPQEIQARHIGGYGPKSEQLVRYSDTLNVPANRHLVGQNDSSRFR